MSFLGNGVSWIWMLLAGLRSGGKPISLKALRSCSNAVAIFCSCLTYPGYGWGNPGYSPTTIDHHATDSAAAYGRYIAAERIARHTASKFGVIGPELKLFRSRRSATPVLWKAPASLGCAEIELS